MNSNIIINLLEQSFQLVGAYYDFDRKKFCKSAELINQNEKDGLYGARNFVYLFVEQNLIKLGIEEQGLKAIDIHKIICGDKQLNNFNSEKTYEPYRKQNLRYINEILKDS